MAWIESHQSLGTHKKLLRLCKELNISDAEAVGHLQYLWWWSLDNAPGGDLSDIPNSVIAEVSRWTTAGKGRKRDPNIFISALITCQFIDKSGENNNKLLLHDWEDYAGKLQKRREIDRERHRKSTGTPQEIPQNSNATVHYSTQHNSTLNNNNDDKSSELKIEVESLIFKTVEDNFQPLTEIVREQINDAINEYGYEKVLWALKQAIAQNHRNLAYASKILENNKAGIHKPNLPRGQPRKVLETDPEKFYKDKYSKHFNR